MRITRIAFFFLLLFFIIGTVSANELNSTDDVESSAGNFKEVYVNDTGDDFNTGSIDNPYASIDRALSNISSSDEAIIYLSKGTFASDHDSNFNINLNHKVYGGNLKFIGSGIDKTFIDGQSAFKFAEFGSNTNITLKNLTFINFKASFCGAVFSEGILNIENCKFKGCYETSGEWGVISSLDNYASLTIKNSIFDGEKLGCRSIYAKCIKDLYLENNTFMNNNFHINNDYGIAIFVPQLNSNSNVYISDNRFVNLSGKNQDASIYINPTYNMVNPTVIVNNTFIDCHTDSTECSIVCLAYGSHIFSNNTFINSSNAIGNYKLLGKSKSLIFDIDEYCLNVSNKEFNNGVEIKINKITDDRGNIISTNSFSFVLIGQSVNYSFSPRFLNDKVMLIFNDVIENGIYNFRINNFDVNVKFNVSLSSEPFDVWVSPNGNNGNDGSESSPFLTIQHALDYAFEKSFNIVVHLLNGTFKGEDNVELDISNKGNVWILGVYNETIIDGDYKHWFLNVNANTNIQNLNFVNGNSTKELISGSKLILENCIVENNNANIILNDVHFNNLTYVNNNGNIFIDYNSKPLTISNSVFVNNTAENYAVIINYCENLTIENCIFINNAADYGGAIYSKGFTSINNYFEGNYALDGGAVYGYSSGDYNFVNNTFVENYATNNGVFGSLSAFASTFLNCKFINNSAKKAGVMTLYVGNLTNCSFINNTAEYGGCFIVLPFFNQLFWNDESAMNLQTLGLLQYIKIRYIYFEEVIFENNCAKYNGNDVYLESINNFPILSDDVLSFRIDLTIDFNDLNTSSLSDNLIANIYGPYNSTVGGDYINFKLNDVDIGSSEIINSESNLNYANLETGNYTLSGDLAHFSNFNNIINNAKVNVKLGDIVDNIEFWISPSGDDENGNGSLNNPYKSISHALVEATKESRNIVIHIMPGTYTGNLNMQLTLSAANNISLIGQGMDNTIVDGENNAYFATVTEGLNNVLISNMTIKNMLPDNRKSRTINSYCPITVNDDSKLYLNNVNISENHGGQAIIKNDGILIIDNSIFSKNGISENGIICGGIVKINDTLIFDNFAQKGLIISDSLFINNSEIRNAYNIESSFSLIDSNSIIENTKISNNGNNESLINLGVLDSKDTMNPALAIDGNIVMNNVSMLNNYDGELHTSDMVHELNYLSAFGYLYTDEKNINAYNSSFVNFQYIWTINTYSNVNFNFNSCLFDNLKNIAYIRSVGGLSVFNITNSIFLNCDLLIVQTHYEERPVPKNLYFENNYWGDNSKPIIKFLGNNGIKDQKYSPINHIILTYEDELYSFKIYSDGDLMEYNNLPITISYGIDEDSELISLFNILEEQYVVSIDENGILNFNMSNVKVYPILPVNQTIFANDISIIRGSDVSFIATFTDKWGDALKYCNVSFVIEDNVIKATTDENGTAYFNINLALGSYIVEVTNPVTHQSIFRTVNVTTDKSIFADDVGAVYGDKSVFSAVFTDEFGYPLINTVVTFNIGDDIVNVTTDEKGSAMFTIKFNAGSYNITSVNPVTGQTISNSIVVSKVTTEITAPKVSMVYNDDKYLTVTLKDANGNYLAKSDVAIKVGSNVYNRVTDSKGQIKLLINLAPNTYSTTVSYAGGNNHIASSLKTSVIVKKATPKLTAAKKTFKKSVKTKKYTITLKNNKNKVMKNTKVYIKVNGKTYAAKTNGKGKATFKITKLTKKGTFKATITYKGSKYYNKLTKKVNIKIK